MTVRLFMGDGSGSDLGNDGGLLMEAAAPLGLPVTVTEDAILGRRTPQESDGTTHTTPSSRAERGSPDRWHPSWAQRRRQAAVGPVKYPVKIEPVCVDGQPGVQPAQAKGIIIKFSDVEVRPQPSSRCPWPSNWLGNRPVPGHASLPVRGARDCHSVTGARASQPPGISS